MVERDDDGRLGYLLCLLMLVLVIAFLSRGLGFRYGD